MPVGYDPGVEALRERVKQLPQRDTGEVVDPYSGQPTNQEIRGAITKDELELDPEISSAADVSAMMIPAAFKTEQPAQPPPSGIDRITQLKQAGFSDEEVSDWATKKRAQFKDAGFADNEIDAYFTRGVTVPEQMPPAIQDRLAAGEMAQKREGGLLQTIPQGIELMSTPEGRGKLWDSVKGFPSRALQGITETLKVPGDVYSGKIDLHTEAGLEQALGLGELIATSRLTKLPLTGRTSGIRPTPFAERPAGTLPPLGDYNPGVEVEISRIQREADGSIHNMPIGDGTPPTSQHFNDAATVVAGEQPPNLSVQNKLLKLYEGQGKYPAELAHDAERDPVIKQELLAKDPEVLPGVREPGPPVEEGPTGFTTAKGSTYEIHGDETTTRNKAPRSDLGHEGDFGPKPRSEQTYYLTEEDMKRLAPPQDAVWRVVEEDGKLSLAIQNPETGQWGIAPSQRGIPAKTKPAIGLQPLEMWGKGEVNGRAAYQNIHPGNPIVAMHSAGPEAIAAAAVQAPDGRVFIGLHHGEALEKAEAAGVKADDLIGLDGFLTTKGRYLSRVESAKVASRANQIEEPATFLENIKSEEGTKGYERDRKRIEAARAGEGPLGAQMLRGAIDRKIEIPPTEPPIPPGAAGAGAPRPPLSLDVAQRLVHERISIGEREPGRFSLSKMYRELVDDLYPIRTITERGYQLARLTRGVFGKAEQFLERATFDFDTLKNNGRAMRDILKPVAKDLDGLRDYMLSKRAIEIAESGRESGVNIEAARVVAKAGETKYGKVASDLVAYQARVLEYLYKSGVLSKAAYEAMLAQGPNYIPFYRLLGGEERTIAGRTMGPQSPVKRLKGSERAVIDPLESIIKNTYAYISVAERNAAGIEIVDALKKQGFDVKEHPVPQIDVELAEFLRDHGITNPQDIADLIQNAMPEKGNTLGAWIDGKRVSVEINDPELVQAFRGLDRESSGMLVKVLAVPARTLRAGAVLTPDFMARNLIRDFLTAFINTSSTIFHPLDTLEGLHSVITKDAHYQDWVKSGGANATMVALDRRYFQESLAKLNGETGLMERGWNVIKTPFRTLRALSEMIENSTRVAEYTKTVGKNVTGGKEAMQEAGFAAREVTLDFARIGAKMRAYNMITAFANAQIQGVDRMVRAFKDRPVNTSLKIAGGITLPSTLLWWANKDDPRYQELPSWQKDLFWIIPTDSWEPISAADAANRPEHLVRERNGEWEFNNGTIYRIPKPFEVGVIFGSGPERILDATIGQNPDAFRGFSNSVWTSLLPNITPTAAQPLVEQFANRSTFTDRTLIPDYLTKKAGGLPEYQYTPYTTELAKKLGQIMASFPGMREASLDSNTITGPAARAVTSPILIENYVRAWTGGLGMYAVNAADYSLRKAGILPDPVTPTPTLADIPFVKAFVVRYPTASTESIQRFYDDYNHNKILYQAFQAKAKEGDVEAVQHIMDIGGDEMFLRLDGIQKTMSGQGKLIRDIYANPTIPRDEKRQLIDTTYYTMIQLARGANDMLRSVKAGRAPAEPEAPEPAPTTNPIIDVLKGAAKGVAGALPQAPPEVITMPTGGGRRG